MRPEMLTVLRSAMTGNRWRPRSPPRAGLTTIKVATAQPPDSAVPEGGRLAY